MSSIPASSLAPAAPTDVLALAAELSGLDRIRRLVPGRDAAALRNVPATWPLLATHFPRKPVLPGVLVLDDLATLAGLAARAASSGPRWYATPGLGGWSLSAAKRVRWRHFVRPGDSVELSVERVGGPDEEPVFRGIARVGDRTVGTVAELRVRAAGGPS